MITYMKETFYHFTCSVCSNGWSISEYPINNSLLTCPHCRSESLIQEKATSFETGLKMCTLNESKIHMAKSFALNHHAFQTYGDKPYRIHLNDVQVVADEFIHYIEENDVWKVRCSIWLHDALELDRKSKKDIFLIAGGEVADIVELLTNDDTKPRKERFSVDFYQQLRTNRLAVFVKLCDRIANVKECVRTKNIKLLKMYRSENALFQEMLDDGQFTEMWDTLNEYLERTHSYPSLKTD